MKAIILGSRRGIRRIDSAKSYPLALLEDPHGQRSLDWLLAALRDCGIDDIVFVGGYHIEKVVHSYTGLRYYFDPDWQSGGNLAALACAGRELDDACLLANTDVVVRAPALKQLLAAGGEVALGVEGGASAQGVSLEQRFTGLAALSAAAAHRLQQRLVETVGGRGATLLQALVDLGLPVTLVQLVEAWARLNSPAALARFAFANKAQTLERLQPLVQTARVLDQVRFSVSEWRSHPAQALVRVEAAFTSGSLVVRSSARSEDSWSQSQAGKFYTELGVPAGRRSALRDAIENVINSYEANGGAHPQDEVFVQPQLEQVTMSGVMFTRHPGSGAPYLVINYDAESERTDTVTSGRGESLATVLLHRPAAGRIDLPPQLRRLAALAEELEGLLGYDALDIEFAFDRAEHLHLLQVRVLAGGGERFELSDADVRNELSALRGYVVQLNGARPHLLGNHTVLANMPDWNPAELIGNSPRPLALSLYQSLITDRIWARARVQCGYRDVGPEPLVVALAGHPYVDVRASLNSFLPDGLAPEIGRRLVEHELDYLQAHPTLHDKLEFEIAVTCLDFDFETQRERLLQNGFSNPEVQDLQVTLRGLTEAIVCGRIAPLEAQLAGIARLVPRREQALSTCDGSILALARAVDYLLEDCRRYGTLPFSIVARYAFIATAFLRSLERRGILSAAELQTLFRAMPSVASSIAADFGRLTDGTLNRSEFLERYGHLRPGTFDITSPSYAEAPDFYLDEWGLNGAVLPPAAHVDEANETLARHESQIAHLIREQGFGFDAQQLLHFVRASIPARERIKFEYSKNISAALGLLVQLGEQMGLSRDDLSFLPIRRLLELSTHSPSNVLQSELMRLANLNRKRHRLHQAIQLPNLVIAPDDVECFHLLPMQPNFVGTARVTGPTVNLNAAAKGPDMRGKIAVIESADPGYDWILGRGIIGLVTKYGGAASHMAIRAAELGLPAAVGCGELLYKRACNAQILELDCAGKTLKAVR